MTEWLTLSLFQGRNKTINSPRKHASPRDGSTTGLWFAECCVQAQEADLVLQMMANDSLYIRIFQSFLGRNMRSRTARKRQEEKDCMFKGLTRNFFSRKIWIALQCFGVEIAFGEERMGAEKSLSLDLGKKRSHSQQHPLCLYLSSLEDSFQSKMIIFIASHLDFLTSANT